MNTLFAIYAGITLSSGKFYVSRYQLEYFKDHETCLTEIHEVRDDFQNYLYNKFGGADVVNVKFICAPLMGDEI